MANDVLSKVKIGSVVYDLKDAEARAKLVTLLGSQDAYDNLNKALGSAAWETYQNAWDATDDHKAEVPSVAAVKSYVDSQVGQIHKFDIVIDKDGTEAGPSVTASADTMYKIYMVPMDDAESGAYVEWLTVRTGAGTEADPYKYVWEKIGTTKTDLSEYVKKEQTIAGIDLQDNITTEELQTALNLGNLAYANTATGSTTLDTIDSITMNDVTVAGNATVTTTDTAATLTKGDYTPAGSVTVTANDAGAVVTGGSIGVTVKDADAATAVSDIEYESYTPAGTIAATDGGNFSALKSAALTEVESTVEGAVQVAGTVSQPAITVTPSKDTFVKSLKAGDVAAATFAEGAFTPASISDGFFSAGSQASYSHTGFSGGSLGDATKSAFATEGIKAAVGTGDDAETLIFTAASTSDAVTAQGAFTAAVYGEDSFTANTLPSIDTTKFNGGSKAADNFASEKIPVVDATASAVTSATAALDNAPVFTGKYYKNNTTSDTALKTVAFTGTAADVKFKGAKYLKQEINTATFTPTKANLGFSGTKVKDMLVTGVNYEKADATAAYTATVTPTTKTITKTAKTISITAAPDAKTKE